MHLEEHRYARKQPDYQKRKFKDPKGFMMLEAGFMKHEVLHQRILDEQMKAMEARAIRMKGER